MADSKISALPASTVPLAGTEVLPIVQSSTTKQVSVANLTAGRAISATQITLTTGNVIVASGRFGPYIKFDKMFVSIPKDENVMNIDNYACGRPA